jgi:hypothetical protein
VDGDVGVDCFAGAGLTFEFIAAILIGFGDRANGGKPGIRCALAIFEEWKSRRSI